MRPSKLTTILAALVAASLCSAREADRFDAHCADVLLLQDKRLQRVLGITKAQVDQMNQFARLQAQQAAAVHKRLDGTKTDENPELYKYFSEFKNSIISVLSVGQLKRLREVSLQRIGPLALCDPVVGTRVGLTEGQMKKLRAVYAEGYKKYSSLERAVLDKVLRPYKGRVTKDKATADALNKEIQAKLAVAKRQAAPQLSAIHDDYDKRMRAVLTSIQWNAFAALEGTPLRFPTS